ncbi:MAG TPA: response regulator transcription factor [Chromatiaceae bacterium]|jgi:two-component system OmpR family response regulator|nr:response regulator transcription factor [Chromatiaceae bacterium]
MARIALLEDEILLRKELAAFLSKRDHEVAQAGTLAEFWPLMPQVDIAILDLMLPDGSGEEVARRLRQEHPRVGILMLTARGAIQDRLQGLDAGADHYLVKPFRLVELAAIIDALLRRLGTGWRLDGQRRLLIAPDGFSSALSVAEMTLFNLLCGHPGEVVTQRTLVEALGFDWLDYDRRRLDKLVSRLRHRWQEESGQELPLKTEYRHGYSFGALIQRL